MAHRYPLQAFVSILFLFTVLFASPALAENGSLLFDGSNDYVNVPEPVDLRGPLTLEAWVKVDASIGRGKDRVESIWHQWL